MGVTASGAMGGGGQAGVIVHGGAGELPEDARALHAEGCVAAAEAAMKLLREGAPALDAVERAVRILEDDPRFNAGTGACLTEDGRVELDAAVMRGADLRFGGVCALPPFAHPISIARAVLDDGVHVLYAGAGAAEFARRAGFTPVSEAALITEAARAKLARALAARAGRASGGGTVGAVARDRAGSVAAATSTGGIAGQRAGRVGDSPIPGAGTWADDLTGAISATGHGEGVLRVALASSLAAALEAGEDAGRAAASALERLERRTGSVAGVIVVARDGTLAFARTTATMTWAAAWDGAPRTCSGW